jgi:hypothetical protein
MRVICYKWGECDVKWSAANWTWKDCRLIDEIIGTLVRPGIPGEVALPPWLREEKPYNPYDKDKRERFIRLLCKVKGEPEYDEKRKVRTDIKITLDDVKLVARAVRGIDIQILEE